MMSKIHAARARSIVLLAALLAWEGSPARPQGLASGEQSIAVGGTERTYLIHIPAHASKPAPVVFVFHGGGGRPQGIERKTGMDALADRYGFIAIYPAGAPSRSGRGGTWNVGGPENVSTADDVAFVRAILHDLEATTPIDHARVYAAGHSMGGVFAYRLACEMSDDFAAIAAVSATMVEPSCRPSSPVAILHIHGTDDDRIPLNGGRGALTAARRSWPAPEQGISAWRQLDGCAGPSTHHDDGFANCATYDQCRATVEFCVIAGGEHPWPAGAAERVWSFFAAHPKSGR